VPGVAEEEKESKKGAQEFSFFKRRRRVTVQSL
jgi:hypothetical protein